MAFCREFAAGAKEALPGEARFVLEKADMLFTLEVTQKHPQEKEAACPPAYFTTPSVCRAIAT
jgi:hypothetical protein